MNHTDVASHRWSWSTRSRALAVLLVSGCSLSACGSGGSDLDTVTEPTVSETAVVKRESQILLPLDDYSFSATQYLAVSDAAYLLTSRCMERFGAPFTQPRQDASAFSDLNNDRLFGLFDMRDARRWGFAPPPDPSAEAAEQSYDWRPSEREEQVLRGETAGTDGAAAAGDAAVVDDEGTPLPPGGCSSFALDELGMYAGPEPPVQPRELYNRAIADSRTQAAFADWSTCMENAGFAYETPPELFMVDWQRPVTDHEIDVATAHVGCAVSTNMVGRWMSVLTAYQDQAIDDHADYYTDLKARNESVLAAAAAVLQR